MNSAPSIARPFTRSPGVPLVGDLAAWIAHAHALYRLARAALYTLVIGNSVLIPAFRVLL